MTAPVLPLAITPHTTTPPSTTSTRQETNR